MATIRSNFAKISESEVNSYVEFINSSLANDSDLQSVFPLQAASLYNVVSDGILFNKMIAKVHPELDLSKLVAAPKNQHEKVANNVITVDGAKTIGCSVVNIGAEDLVNKNETLIKGLLWQIIKITLLKVVVAADLSRTLNLPGLEDAPPETILLRWFNFHLDRCHHHRVVKNWTSDLQDSENFAVLLTQVAPDKVTTDDLENILRETNLEKRAELLLKVAEKANVNKFVSVKDIVEGNPRMNLAFTATIFKEYPALGPSREQLAEQRAEKLQTQLTTLQQEHQVITTEKNQSTARVAELQTELQSVKQQAQQDKTQAESTITELKEQNAKSQATISELTQKMGEEKNQYEAEIARLKERVAELQNELEKVRTESNKTIQELQMELLATEEEKDSEKSKLLNEMSSKEARARAELEAANKQREEEVAKLSKEAEDALNKFGKLSQRSLKQGVLMKLSSNPLMGWQKRYLVLKDNMLAWFKDEKSSTSSRPQGLLFVENARLYHIDKEAAGGKEFVFEFNDGDHVRRFKAASADELKEWMQAINQAKAKTLGLTAQARKASIHIKK